MLAAEELGDRRVDPIGSADRPGGEPVAEAFERHSRAVFRYALRRTEDEWEAEDVVAEVFAVAWRRASDLPEEPLPWLYGIARNVVANRKRSGRRRARLHAALSSDAATNDVAARPESDGPDALADLLAGLSEADQEALMLTAWEGLSPKEAAVAAGCSAGAFRLRLMRARRRLKRRLDERSDTSD